MSLMWEREKLGVSPNQSSCLCPHFQWNDPLLGMGSGAGDLLPFGPVTQFLLAVGGIWHPKLLLRGLILGHLEFTWTFLCTLS